VGKFKIEVGLIMAVKGKRRKQIFFLKYICILILISLSACKLASDKPDNQVIYYNFPEGEVAHFTLRNRIGMEVQVINYGATVTHVKVPDWMGRVDDVVLGFDSVHSYLTGPNPYFGCVVGRYANRIANARFILNGDTIELNANNGDHSIHGGKEGFSRRIWSVESFTDSTLVLSYFSPDGEEGFPGNLQVKLTYAVTSENELIIDYQATTDKTTVVNLTNHSYFNLSGGKESTVLNHELYLNGYQYTEVDSALIPTGNIVELEGGAMDFSCFCRKRIGQDIEQVENGYDHNWILNKSDERLSLAAVVYEPLSGRGMEVKTTQPGIQFYSGNFLKPTIVGKKGISYQKYAGICLETQHYPDSPNHPHFPSTILKPNEEYKQTTIYRFFTW